MSVLIRIHPDNPAERTVRQAVEILQKGGVIIYPTDTVYGLACNCYSEKAIERIFDMKNRARNKPICVLTNSVDKLVDNSSLIHNKSRKTYPRHLFVRLSFGPHFVFLYARFRSLRRKAHAPLYGKERGCGPK